MHQQPDWLAAITDPQHAERVRQAREAQARMLAEVPLVPARAHGLTQEAK